MLELRSDNEILDISSVQFNLTLHSPVAEKSGSYVYAFTIPYSLTNAHAFGFPFRLTAFETVQSKKPGQIIVDGVTEARGTWLAKATNSRTITIEMYIAAGEFNELMRKKKLPELFDVELAYEDIIDHIETQVTKTWPEANHNWPCVHVPAFYGTGDDCANPDYQGVLNDWDSASVHIETFNNNAISPQLYLGYIISRILEQAGYTMHGNAFDDAMLQRAVLFNNYALDRLIPTRFSGAMYHKFPIYDSYVLIWDEDLMDPGGHYTESTGKYNVDKEGNYKIDIYLKHRPDTVPTSAEEARLEVYYGSTLIDYDQRPYAFGAHSYFELNYTHTENILQADIGDDIWCKYYYLDGSSNVVACEIIEGTVTIENEDAEQNNTFDSVLNYKNHVPDMDVKEFFAEFCNTVKVLPFFDHIFRRVRLVLLDDLLASNRQRDVDQGTLRHPIKIKPQTYEGLKFMWNFQGPDDNLNDNFIDMEQATVQGEVDTWDDLLAKSGTEGHIWFVESLNCYYIWGLIKPWGFLVKDWAESTAYVLDDLVKYDDVIYKCITAHTSGATFNSGYWKDHEWIPYSDNQYDYVDGDGKKELPCALAPALMRAVRCTRDGATNLVRNLPSVDLKGTSLAYGIKNEFPLRIMFWHGIESGDTDQYPIASTTMLSTEGTEILTINWDWESIVPRYYTNFIRWHKRRKQVEFQKEVTPAEIANNDFEEKGNAGGALLLFEEIVVKVKNNFFGPAKFKGWTR